MTVGSILKKSVPTLNLESTFGEALAALARHSIRGIPVVDGEGVYLGMFDLFDVWELLLPREAIQNPNYVMNDAEITELAAREKLAFAESRSIVEFLDDHESPALYPDSPVAEAMRWFHRKGTILPVVERGTRKLLGIVTPWEVIEKFSS